MQLLKKAKAYRIEIKWGVIWGVSSWLIVLIGFDSGSYAVTRAFNSPIGIFIALPTYIPFKLASIILPITVKITGSLLVSRTLGLLYIMGIIIPVFPIFFGILLVYIYRRTTKSLEINRSVITRR